MEAQHSIDPKERQQRIEEAAYLRAERRGFVGGDPVADWMDAEQQVDAELGRHEHRRLLEELEARLETATKKLKALKKKASSLTAEARKELDEDVQKLAALRAALEKRFEKVSADADAARQEARRVASAAEEAAQSLQDAERAVEKAKQALNP